MKTKNLAVGALAAVLVLALWWNFLLKPTRAKASKVKADTEAERAKLPPLQAQLAQANADAAHAGEIKAQLAALKAAVPNSPALAAFIRDANSIAEESGLAWQSVTHGLPVPGIGAKSITVGIQIKGTYEQAVDYLARLAKLERLFVVDGVQFTSASSSGAGESSAGASTGPFSGASQLTVTVSGRMFETPPALPTDASGTGTGTTPGSAVSGGSAPNTQGAQSSTVNNS